MGNNFFRNLRLRPELDSFLTPSLAGSDIAQAGGMAGMAVWPMLVYENRASKMKFFWG